jgi:hypothetical protein
MISSLCLSLDINVIDSHQHDVHRYTAPLTVGYLVTDSSRPSVYCPFLVTDYSLPCVNSNIMVTALI